MKRQQLIDAYCLIAGLADLSTGLLLVAAPLPALHLMMIPQLPAEPIYMRWIGVFVAATGAYYLLPFRLRDPARRRDHLRVVFEMTAVVRLMVALFVGACIAQGALALPWATVACFDGITSIGQVIALRKRWLDG